LAEHGALRCINLNMMGERFSRGLLNAYVVLIRASLLQEIMLSFRVNQKTCESDWKDFVASLTNLSATLQKVNINLHVDSVINNSGIQAFRDAIMSPSYFISPHVKFNLTMLENARLGSLAVHGGCLGKHIKCSFQSRYLAYPFILLVVDFMSCC
jgi:hypothetical protein